MNRSLVLAILILASSNSFGTASFAANPPAGASATARRYMPKWVYYDRLGLAAWNKGERPTAKTHWEYAMNLCENDLRGRPKGGLDKQTKIWINDLISHMTFLMTYYEQPSAQALRGLTAQQAMIKLKQATVDDIDRKLREFDKLESFAKMLVGRETYVVQDFRMLRRKQLMMQEQYKREICDLKGETYRPPNATNDGSITIIEDRKTVKRPAWWNETAATPVWKRNNLSVGSYEKAARPGKPTTGVSKAARSGQPAWMDKGDKPEIPGVSYVGGKQVKRQDIDVNGHQWRPAQGDSSPLWGQNPYNEINKPNKWGTQAERNQALDLNSKAKAPNWGENSQPKDTTTTGWGNNGGSNDQTKPPDGAGQVVPQPQGGNYWK